MAHTRQRLAAILAADAAGYSRLMSRDEQATIAALDESRDTFRLAIQARNGRVVDTAGDSVLALFDTAANAVNAALEIQQALEARGAGMQDDQRMRFRIGVHMGDITEKADGSVYGDGVNVAARIQGLALPGGIAVSDAVRGAVLNRVPAAFEDIGTQLVKNISEPLHAFRIRPPGLPDSDDSGATLHATNVESPSGADAGSNSSNLWRPSRCGWPFRVLALGGLFVIVCLALIMGSINERDHSKDKSIAVLPFVDLSERHDQEYFSDGLSEELIDQLARAGPIRVIARTSSFQFKGKSEDVRSIAQKLGVTHLLEGSVRRSGDQLRITAQLINARDGTQQWSQTYSRGAGSIFEVQDEIARTVAESLQVALSGGPAIGESRPASVQTYNLLLQGLYFERRNNRDDLNTAIKLYKEAIELEPSYALAWARQGNAHALLAANFGSMDDIGKAREATERALTIDPNLAEAHGTRAFILRAFDWDWRASDAEYRRAQMLSPDPSKHASAVAGMDLKFGRPDAAIAATKIALDRDPLSVGRHFGLGYALYFAGRYAEAVNAFRKVSEMSPTYGSVRALLGTCLLLQGKSEEALSAVESERDDAWRLSVLPVVYWSLGRKPESDAAMVALVKHHAAGAAFNIAQAYAYRGEIDFALDWLEKAYLQHDSGLTWSKVDPLLDNLHGDPRYQAFLVKMKLDGDGPR